jgi:hypothetical protein
MMLSAIEQQAVELRRKDGLSIEKIVKATGLPERKVKVLVKDVPKPSKAKKVVAKIPTPLAKSVERVFTLASRVQGIRDYELRNILHEEYGSTWDTKVGRYNSNYDKDHIKRVKTKVRERAAQDDCNVIFVMDWVDERKPTASRTFLETAASDLMARIEAYADEYMEHHATRWKEDNVEADLAQRKQRYAAKRHLLKLAIRGYAREPVDVLLERSAALTNTLEGNPDVPLSASGARALDGSGTSDAEPPEYYPEPSRANPFLDFVESQGWLKEVEHRFI